MSARDEILGRIRDALRDVPAGERPEDVPVSRRYARSAGDGLERVGRFVERVADYGSHVRQVPAAELPEALAGRCRERGVRRLAVPGGLPPGWLPQGVEPVREAELDAAGLDAIDGALTGCALAIALTGTIVLAGGPRQGKRRLTLVPDYHLCVVEERQIVATVPEALTQIAAELRRGPGWVTLVSGPSATADIEFARVEGVHGPRTLDVFVTA